MGKPTVLSADKENSMEQLLLPFLLLVFCLIIIVYHDLWFKPKMLRLKLQRQGIDGPQPSPIMGNIPEIKHIKSLVQCSENSCNNRKDPPSLDCSSILFPYFQQWTKQYGKTFSFQLGTVPVLYVTDPELVREINLCRSLDLGKPAYLQKDRGPLLGKGLITTNRAVWTHQRKTIAPNLYVDKVKDMLYVVIESAKALVKSWESMVESEGGVTDIRVDEYVRNFTCQVFSKIMFGSNSSVEIHLLPKCRALIEASGTPTILSGIPFYRRACWLSTMTNNMLAEHDDYMLAEHVKMVVQEVLRLYPGAAFVSREALQDVKLGKLVVPKGVNIWIWLLELQQDPKLWGPDAHKFNPWRFANEVSGACKNSQAYIPFGVGARICPGQSLAILEMRVMFAVILANFSLSLSPNYRHIPNFGLLLEPKYGVNLLVRKI